VTHKNITKLCTEQGQSTISYTVFTNKSVSQSVSPQTLTTRCPQYVRHTNVFSKLPVVSNHG